MSVSCHVAASAKVIGRQTLMFSRSRMSGGGSGGCDCQFKLFQMHLLRTVEMFIVLSPEMINKPLKVNLKFSKVNLIKSRIY